MCKVFDFFLGVPLELIENDLRLVLGKLVLMHVRECDPKLVCQVRTGLAGKLQAALTVF